MILSPLRWLLRNFGTLILAFALAMVVWISAVTAADPDEVFVLSVPLERISQDPNLVLMAPVPEQVRVTLRAPRSIRDRMANNDNAVRAWIDLSGLSPGTHTIEVRTQTGDNIRPVRVVAVNPESVSVILEPSVARNFQVRLEVTGEPAVGYQKGLPARDPTVVLVSGPESLVNQVDEVRTALDISEARETIDIALAVQAVDAEGQPVRGVSITPGEVTVTQPITLQGGYRNVVVKPATEGQVATGYRLTNISVSPPNLLVFSTDPQLVIDLPSFIETTPVDVTGAEEDIERLVALDLPEGILVVGERTVLVQVSIAAIEGSLTVTVPVEPVGMEIRQAALVTPESVDLILSGPVPVLNGLTSGDIRVIAEVEGLALGVHQVTPIIEILPDGLQVETVLPSVVEVEIIIAPTPTPTPRPTPVGTPQP